MRHPIKTLVQDYGWIHLSIGLAGNTLFLVGSILFLFNSELKPIPGAIFISGSFLMLVGALGNLLVKLYERHEG